MWFGHGGGALAALPQGAQLVRLG
ncbi:protein of unknown function [Candidatus Methylocalor cossyra]|uniref:Uncharacterized protein n=1 Tax=Candidatus Methylocalor cossyra TaxID=3108543 RepID=A0ABM9NKF3_9GAMM